MSGVPFAMLTFIRSRARRLVRAAAHVALLWSVSGCAYLRTATIPIGQEPLVERGAERARGLVVLLPGIHDGMDAFRREGIVDALERVAPGWDAVAVDAHVGYYRNRDNSVVERLEHDVVAPARRRGYRQVWLVGVSLGGLGAMLFASQQRREKLTPVDGIIALAPYPGPDDLLDELGAAGGLRAWTPAIPEGASEEDRFFRELWAWFKGYDEPAERPPLFLGIGGRDDFALGNRYLAEVLPRDHVVVIEDGGHDWVTWRSLFETLAARALGAAEEPPRSNAGGVRTPDELVELKLHARLQVAGE